MKKISNKIALYIGAILAAVFIVLLTVNVFLVMNVVETQVNAHFSLIASSNVDTVEKLMSKADEVNSGIEDYFTKRFTDYAAENEIVIRSEALANGETAATAPEVQFVDSIIYDNLKVSPLSTETEKYIINSLWSSVRNNSVVNGAAVIFAPYSFDQTIKDYAIYVDQPIAEAQSYDAAFTDDYYNEDYYIIPSTTGKTYISEPFLYNGQNIVTIANPVIVGGYTIAVVTVDILAESLEDINVSDENYPTLQVAITNDAGKYIMNSVDESVIGSSYFDTIPNANERLTLEANKEKGVAFTQIVNGYTTYFAPISVGENVWWVQNGATQADLYKDVAFGTIVLAVMIIIAFIILLLNVYFIPKKALSNLDYIVEAADAVSKGDLPKPIEINSKDEIGLLAEKFNAMSSILGGLIIEIQRVLSELADGNLDVKIGGDDIYVGSLTQIKESFDKILNSLNSTMNQIKVVSKQVNDGSNQVAMGAQILAQGTIKQAASIEELQETMKKLSERVSENAGNAKEADSFSTQTQTVVDSSTEKMNQLLYSMKAIQEASMDIEKIIKTIDDIAFQTNILALNAAVEAARAGEAGKGFAVVADEVRNLAQKSSDAAKNTSELIKSSLEAVNKGAQIANSTNESFKEVESSAKNSSERIKLIAIASEEQSTSINELFVGVQEIASVIQNNTATSEESAAASEQLSAQSNTLSTLVERFSINDQHSDTSFDMPMSEYSSYDYSFDEMQDDKY